MDDFDSALDKGSFLILPATGMTLIAIGVFIIIVANYPDIIPFILTSTLPQQTSSFLVGYYNDYKPQLLQPPYPMVVGLVSIGLGSFFDAIRISRGIGRTRLQQGKINIFYGQAGITTSPLSCFIV